MVVNPPLILVSALFFLGASSLLYLASWGVILGARRLGRGRFSPLVLKWMCACALVLPPLVAMVLTADGATLRHNHATFLHGHHSAACLRVFGPLFSLTEGPGDLPWIGGALIHGGAWVLLIWGLTLSLRLIAATVRLERGLVPFLEQPSIRLAGALARVEGYLPGTLAGRFFECAIPAGYSGVIGILRPRCVLARRLVETAGDDELDAIVAHEAAHLRAWDLVGTFVVNAVSCLFFTLPPVQDLARRWREETELSCDATAAATTGQPLALATAILRASGATLEPPVPRALPGGLAFTDETVCSAEKRIERLISQAQAPFGQTASPPALAALGGWSLTLGLAACGLAGLLSAHAACVVHCSLEALAHLLP